jgi:hypothetical protein
MMETRQFGTKTVRHPLKDSSAPRHFGTVEKKCQIGTAFSFKYKFAASGADPAVLKTGSQALVCQFLSNLYLKENAVPI